MVYPNSKSLIWVLRRQCLFSRRFLVDKELRQATSWCESKALIMSLRFVIAFGTMIKMVNVLYTFIKIGKLWLSSRSLGWVISGDRDCIVSSHCLTRVTRFRWIFSVLHFQRVLFRRYLPKNAKTLIWMSSMGRPTKPEFSFDFTQVLLPIPFGSNSDC